MVDERLDLLGQVPDASERASPNRALRDDVEPDLDLIEPGGVDRGVVDVGAGTRGQSAEALAAALSEREFTILGADPIVGPQRSRCGGLSPHLRSTLTECPSSDIANNPPWISYSLSAITRVELEPACAERRPGGGAIGLWNRAGRVESRRTARPCGSDGSRRTRSGPKAPRIGVRLPPPCLVPQRSPKLRV